jgi:hypothetical protein
MIYKMNLIGVSIQVGDIQFTIKRREQKTNKVIVVTWTLYVGLSKQVHT